MCVLFIDQKVDIMQILCTSILLYPSYPSLSNRIHLEKLYSSIKCNFKKIGNYFL